MDNDDGARTRHYNAADIILVGYRVRVKRRHRLYLALQFGIRAANYPLTEDDIMTISAKALREHKDKLFGLLFDTDRLVKIRRAPAGEIVIQLSAMPAKAAAGDTGIYITPAFQAWMCLDVRRRNRHAYLQMTGFEASHWLMIQRKDRLGIAHLQNIERLIADRVLEHIKSLLVESDK